MQQREGDAPKVRGSEALALIGAWYFMDRSEYALLAQEALREIQMRPPLQGPRILIKGSPLDSPDFCAAIESHGAIVVAEDDWWGSRAAGRDIDTTDRSHPRHFREILFRRAQPACFSVPKSADAWFLRKAREVDGVIFYLPHEDDVFGWDYPRLRASLDERAIPHLMLRDRIFERNRSIRRKAPEWLRSNWNARFAPPRIKRSGSLNCAKTYSKTKALRHRAG